MIDVSHPHTNESSQHFIPTNHERQASASHQPNGSVEQPAEPEDAEEAAWLQSIQSAGLDSDAEVKGLQSGALVMDISQLRQDAAPPSAKKNMRSAVR